MKRFTWKRAAAALMLMAVLSLAAPPPAQAAGRGVGGPAAWSDGAWAWATWFWDQLATLLHGGGARPHAAAKSGATAPTDSSPDIGPVIEPNGSPPPPTPP